jgi:hypothetical protein
MNTRAVSQHLAGKLPASYFGVYSTKIDGNFQCRPNIFDLP